MMFFKNLVIGVTAAAYLTGCSGGTIFKEATLGSTNVLSVDARQRLVFEGTVQTSDGPQHVVCTEPSPDAIVAQAAQFAASANGIPNGANGTAGGSVGAGFSESAASIAMRTQTIQLLRDGYYRLCEAYLNGALDKREYRMVIMFIDEFIATVVAIEALGGTVQTAPVAVGAGGSVSLSSDPNKNTVTSDFKLPSLDEKSLSLQPANGENAEAIKQILSTYLKDKARFMFIYRCVQSSQMNCPIPDGLGATEPPRKIVAKKPTLPAPKPPVSPAPPAPSGKQG